MIKSLYINLEPKIRIKDNTGKLLEEYSIEGLNNFQSVIKALEIAVKYSRNKVYVFTSDKKLVNRILGRLKLKSKKEIKGLLEIKLFETFFQTVRYFVVNKKRLN